MTPNRLAELESICSPSGPEPNALIDEIACEIRRAWTENEKLRAEPSGEFLKKMDDWYELRPTGQTAIFRWNAL